MRTIALALIGISLATAAPIAANAEGDRTIQNYAPSGSDRYDRSYDYWNNGNSLPGYVYAPRRSWNGCPPHYIVRHGVCERYR